MKLTQEYINDLFLIAHHADRSLDHYKELAQAQSLQDQYNRLTGVGKQYTLYFPIEKKQTKGYKATSVKDALGFMEKNFGR